MENNINKSFYSNVGWGYLERAGAQAIIFVINLILARKLLPSDYGIIATAEAYVLILQTFLDCGFSTALIQKKEADESLFATAFSFNLLASILLYCLLFVFSKRISEFYDNPQIEPILRVLGLSLIFFGVRNIMSAYVTKKLIFKKFFYTTLLGTMSSAVMAVLLAYQGAGVWALAAQHLTDMAVCTITLCVIVKWKPKLHFSLKKFKELVSFGWKYLCSSLIKTLYDNLKNLIIGKKYTSTQLGYLYRGEKFPQVILLNINNPIGNVLLPVLAREQADIYAVKQHVRRTIQIGSYIIWPAMMGMVFCAEPFVRVLLTEKWLPCVPYLRIACFALGLAPIQTANLQAITAMGRGDCYLKLELIKKTVGIVLVLLAMDYSVVAIALAAVLMELIGTVINAWPNQKVLQYPYWQQMADALPPFLLAFFMGACIYFVSFWGLSDLMTLAIQMLFGCSLYIGCSHILKLESYLFLKKGIKEFLKERYKNT